MSMRILRVLFVMIILTQNLKLKGTLMLLWCRMRLKSLKMKIWICCMCSPEGREPKPENSSVLSYPKSKYLSLLYHPNSKHSGILFQPMTMRPSLLQRPKLKSSISFEMFITFFGVLRTSSLTMHHSMRSLNMCNRKGCVMMIQKGSWHISVAGIK